MRHKNTDLRDSIMRYVDECCINEGREPSVREVGRVFGISKSNAQRYMAEIRKESLSPRIGKYNDDRVSAAWLENSIACGAPTYEEENIRMYVQLPTAVFGGGEKYILTARGDSMIKAGITEGDIVVVRKQVTAEPGDIVVALLNGENTLKRLMFREDGRPYLHPENDALEDIDIGEDDALYIQGVASYVIKGLQEQ